MVIYYLLKIFKQKNKKNHSKFNFGPNISSCKSVLYISKYLSKYLKLKIIINKKNSKKIFKPETSVLRLIITNQEIYLSGIQSGQLINLNKIIEWNNKVKQVNVQVCFNKLKIILKINKIKNEKKYFKNFLWKNVYDNREISAVLKTLRNSTQMGVAVRR